ncbi:lysophosphatidylserine lipase ABHD12-like [Rhynchophorus ferrugineus]
MCWFKRKKRSSEDSYNSIDSPSNDRKWPLWKMILVWSLVALFALVLLVFLLIFVVFPITFWLCYTLQRFMTFIPINSPKNPNFNDPGSYGIQNVQNFYITVPDYYDTEKLTKIGAWLILPENYPTTISNAINITEILQNTSSDILFYLHGVAANRAKPISQYTLFRKYFLVIAIDHRGYGDSGEDVELSEDAIVSDNLHIFDWLRKINSKSNIYYWGHSLGTGISCHTVSSLKEKKDFVPHGLVLEAPFTSMADEIAHVMGKVFGWLAYFNATIVRPVGENGILFESSRNILNINCPIMIMNAKDDGVIPWTFGERLYHTAIEKRNLNKQGNITFHSFPADKAYGHNDVTTDPSVPHLIEDFIQMCNEFNQNNRLS